MPLECSANSCTDPVSARGLCKRHYNAAAYRKNRTKAIAREQAIRDEDRDAYNARAAGYREANRQRIRTRDRAKYAADSNRRRDQAARARRQYAADPEIRIAQASEWSRANPEKRQAIVERRRARKVAGTVPGVAVDEGSIAARFAYYGNRCYLCGGPADAVDHVIPLALGGLHIPANLRPICHSDNSSKGGRSLDSFYARKVEREISETG